MAGSGGQCAGADSQKRPGLLFGVSFISRTLIVIGGFWLVTKGDWLLILACLAAFIGVRSVLTRRWGPAGIKQMQVGSQIMELTPDNIVYAAWGWVTINATLVFTWVAMAVLLVMSWLATRRSRWAVRPHGGKWRWRPWSR
jgi:hypothetical protein